MATFDTDDLETMSYVLPKHSRLRLKKLCEYAECLSHLAQPHRVDAGQEAMPGIGAGKVATCLALLAEQMGRVLDDLAQPARRSESDALAGAGAEPAAAQALPDDAEGRYLFGMTVDQVDALHRLIDMIVAHGDVVTASDEAGFADHTLSVLGNAIFNDARSVRAIIRQVESQRLEPVRGSHTGVAEERAIYRVGQACSPAESAAPFVWPRFAGQRPWRRDAPTRRANRPADRASSRVRCRVMVHRDASGAGRFADVTI